MLELLIADSFRVREHPESGEVEARGSRLHFERFRDSAFEVWCGTGLADAEVARLTPHQSSVLTALNQFLDDAAARIAAAGSGWPRLELWAETNEQGLATGNPRLRLSLRPLPELQESIKLRSAGSVLPEHAEHKGPNITLFTQLNSELGAEAILHDASGFVTEGATTSLLWWHEGKLRQTDPHGRVKSVTERLLMRFAMTGGLSDHHDASNAKVTASNLAEHEVWAVNALHGIRIVTEIDETPLPRPNETRLRLFNDALNAAWEPILGEGTQFIG